MDAKLPNKDISGESIIVPSCDHERHKQMGVLKIVGLRKNHEERKRKKNTRWSDLPTELLQEIMAELNLADQIRFRYVCKNWLLPFQEGRPIDKLPWLLKYGEYGPYGQSQFLYKLYDPIGKKPYTISGLCRDHKEDFISMYPKNITSKHGWVFFSMEDMDTGRISFILFSPFTNEIMTLPDLVIQNNDYLIIKKIAFSMEPTSKECVFFIVFLDGNFTTVGTYQHGYTKWITKKFHWSMCGFDSMMYFEGNLYCVYIQGSSSVYNVAQQKWYLIDSIRPEFAKIRYKRYHLFESSGELLVVCLESERFNGCGVYKFDRFTMSWIVQTSIPNRALFIGVRNSLSVPAFGEIKHIENKVFYFDSYRMKDRFYSVIDGKTYDCEGTEYEYLFKKSEQYQPGIWIDCPPYFVRRQFAEPQS